MTRRSISNFIRFSAVCGLFSAAIFTLNWIWAGLLEDNYDNLRQDISDFGALTASHPLPYNLLLSFSSALLVVFAIGLWMSLGRGWSARIGVVVLGVVGVGNFLDGLWREDCSPSGDKVCQAAVDAGDVSWHHQAHDLESIVTLSAMILSPIVLAFAFRRREQWRDLFVWSLAAGAIAFVAMTWYAVLYTTQDGSGYSGALERALAVVSMLWIAAVAWRLLRLTPNAATEPLQQG